MAQAEIIDVAVVKAGELTEQKLNALPTGTRLQVVLDVLNIKEEKVRSSPATITKLSNGNFQAVENNPNPPNKDQAGPVDVELPAERLAIILQSYGAQPLTIIPQEKTDYLAANIKSASLASPAPTLSARNDGVPFGTGIDAWKSFAIQGGASNGPDLAYFTSLAAPKHNGATPTQTGNVAFNSFNPNADSPAIQVKVSTPAMDVAKAIGTIGLGVVPDAGAANAFKMNLPF